MSLRTISLPIAALFALACLAFGAAGVISYQHLTAPETHIDKFTPGATYAVYIDKFSEQSRHSPCGTADNHLGDYYVCFTGDAKKWNAKQNEHFFLVTRGCIEDNVVCERHAIEVSEEQYRLTTSGTSYYVEDDLISWDEGCIGKRGDRSTPTCAGTIYENTTRRNLTEDANDLQRFEQHLAKYPDIYTDPAKYEKD